VECSENYRVCIRRVLGELLSVTILSAFFLAVNALGQQSNAPPPQAASNGAEITSEDKPTTFKLRVNVVEVHVVVRDAKGNAVPGLKREDFRLLDQGKQQTITNFAAESAETRKQRAAEEAKVQTEVTSEKAANQALAPHHFVAMMFDDTHLSDADLMYARNSVIQFLDTIGPQDRVGFSSVSGQFSHEFTADKDSLKAALSKLKVLPNLTDQLGGCPRVGYYMANLVDTVNDQDAFQVIVEDTLHCGFGGDSSSNSMAVSMAKSAVRQTIAMAQADNNVVYDHMLASLRWVAGMPGERTLIFVSPGFSLAQDRTRLSQIMDLATKNRIPINTLDARGLYVPGQGDIASGGIPNTPISGVVQPVVSVPSPGIKTTPTANLGGRMNTTYRATAEDEQALVLGNLADGTGGTFFHHSNDLAGGMKTMATPPAYSYVLAFSPQTPKMDGSFHKLKVELTGNQKYEIKARAGYYAPKKSEDPEEQTREDIEQAVYSREEIADIPMDLRTQYFMKAADDAQLAVVTHLNVKNLHFQDVSDRKCNKLTVVTAIFDNNGNYVLGQEKTVNLKLSAKGYDHVVTSGLAFKTTFDLKPGNYLVRQVVREAEGSQMSARTGSVEIPN
jgi:VWFA-related protein